MRSWKGHDHLFEALAQLRRDDLQLVIVGDGPRREHLHRLADTLSLNKQIQFIGQQANVIPWLQSLDLAVLPSYGNEGVPQSLIQAMACGVTVLSTPIGAIKELIHDNETGRLTPPSNPAQLAQAITELIDHPETRASLSNRGNAFARAHYNIDDMLNQMETIFENSRRLSKKINI